MRPRARCFVRLFLSLVVLYFPSSSNHPSGNQRESLFYFFSFLRSCCFFSLPSPLAESLSNSSAHGGTGMTAAAKGLVRMCFAGGRISRGEGKTGLRRRRLSIPRRLFVATAIPTRRHRRHIARQEEESFVRPTTNLREKKVKSRRRRKRGEGRLSLSASPPRGRKSFSTSSQEEASCSLPL